MWILVALSLTGSPTVVIQSHIQHETCLQALAELSVTAADLRRWRFDCTVRG